MNYPELQRAIEEQLALRKKQVVNRNAFAALFAAFADPMGALGRIFLGRDQALDEERQKIAQEASLELLCSMDKAISDLASTAARNGLTIAGLIETSASHADRVVGVEIDAGAGPVTFQPGTHIRTSASSSRSVTGLKIGGKDKP
jgi:hypothetical protein